MNGEMRIAYIRAMTVNAEAAIEGMKAANAEAALRGLPPVYVQHHFDAIPQNHGITHNQVIGYLTER